MRKAITVVVTVSVLVVQAAWASADAQRIAQATGGTGEKSSTSTEKMPGKGVVGAVKVRGTISAIDKDAGTVTLKGPKGRTVTLEVRDKSKFDVIKVGDPVVAVYMEAVAIQARKAGTGAPGVTTQESRVTSQPGETPAGAIGREVTVTGTITKIDKKAGTVTIKGPAGKTETITAKDPKNLEGIKAGDLVDITYSQALAVSLDKAPSKASK
jgi:Cu/Ag efflux protein CusF